MGLKVNSTITFGKLTVQFNDETKQARFITQDFDKIRGITFRTSKWISHKGLVALHASSQGIVEDDSNIMKGLKAAIEELSK